MAAPDIEPSTCGQCLHWEQDSGMCTIPDCREEFEKRSPDQPACPSFWDMSEVDGYVDALLNENHDEEF